MKKELKKIDDKLDKITEEDLIALEKKLIKLRSKELKNYQFNKNPFKVFAIDFLEGMFKGVGFFIGGTVIIAILAILLTKYFAEIPVVGDYFNQVGKWLQIESQNESINLD